MIAGFKTLDTTGSLKIGKLSRTPEALELEAELKELEQQAFDNFQLQKEGGNLATLEIDAIRLQSEIKATRTRLEIACKDVLMGSNIKCPHCGEYKIVIADKRDGGRIVAHIVRDDCCRQQAEGVIERTRGLIKNAQRQDVIRKINFQKNNQERAASKGLTPEQRSEILNRPYRPDPNEISELAELAGIAERLEKRITKGQIRDAQELQYA